MVDRTNLPATTTPDRELVNSGLATRYGSQPRGGTGTRRKLCLTRGSAFWFTRARRCAFCYHMAARKARF